MSTRPRGGAKIIFALHLYVWYNCNSCNLLRARLRHSVLRSFCGLPGFLRFVSGWLAPDLHARIRTACVHASVAACMRAGP